MRPIISVFALFFGLIAAWSQSPPTVKTPPSSPPVLGATNRSVIMQGTIVAYDWSTRYYMEGARVENFIFKANSPAANPNIVRVVLLWHPADHSKILPKDFYAPGKIWQLTLGTTSPFDFVRQYCITKESPTIIVDVGNGKKAKLQRYVSPTVLPPGTNLTTNFRTAIETRPTSPEMPDTTAMQCVYLEHVKIAEQ